MAWTRQTSGRLRRLFLSALSVVFLGGMTAASALAAPQSKVVAVLPLSPGSVGLPQGASGALRDLICAELSRRGGRSKSGWKAVPVLFPQRVDGGESEAVSCPDADGDAASTDSEAFSQVCAAQSVHESRRGLDEAALRHLEQALIFSHEKALEWESHSPRLHANAQDIRRQMASKKGAALRVIASVPDAVIHIDGVKAGTTAVVVTGLKMGRHHILETSPSLGQSRAFFSSVPPLGEDTPPLRLSLGDGDLQGLLHGLSEGKLGESWPMALRLCADHQATHLLLGALKKRGDDIELQTALVDVASRRFVRLSQVSFDAELLMAGSVVQDLVTNRVLPVLTTDDAWLPLAETSRLFDPAQDVTDQEVSFEELVAQEGPSPHHPRSTHAPTSEKSRRQPIDPRRPTGALKDRR